LAYLRGCINCLLSLLALYIIYILKLDILIYPLAITYLIHDFTTSQGFRPSHIRTYILHPKKIEGICLNTLWQAYKAFLVAVLATVCTATARRNQNFRGLAILTFWALAVSRFRYQKLVRKIQELDEELDEMAHRLAATEDAAFEMEKRKSEGAGNGRMKKWKW
jgi:hypothetical protein